jgi:hypothetical protein
MKMADVLRDLADKLDSIESGTDDTPKQTGLNPVGDVQGGDTDTSKFVPPLQTKLEILKKSAGLPNVYDNDEQDGDELAMLKQRAGLSPCQQEASEDNDITG